MKKILSVENKKLNTGDVFELAGLKWTILDITEKGYMCLADRLECSMQFGSNNDWKESHIREYLNGKFTEMLAAEIGTENIVPFERDLLSLDGQTEYGSCIDTVSLLNVDEYRKHRKHIPNTGYWWWLLTPDSTKCNNDEDSIIVVSPFGYFNFYSHFSGHSVRPFCIFSSALFESEDK